MAERTCTIDGCERPHAARGWCAVHYMRWKRNGDPLAELRMAPDGEPMAWLRALAVAEPVDECVTWPYARVKGYARVHHEGRNYYATHVILELVGKPRPDESLHAAHSCGKGHDGCVNPAHLRWATPKQNHADKLAHGTHNRGERQWQAKLTEADVLAIRADPRTQVAIAADYGVTGGLVSQIKRGKSWAWLD